MSPPENSVTLDEIARWLGVDPAHLVDLERAHLASRGWTGEDVRLLLVGDPEGSRPVGILTVDFEPLQSSLRYAAEALEAFKAQLEAPALPPAGITISDRLARDRDRGRRRRR